MTTPLLRARTPRNTKTAAEPAAGPAVALSSDPVLPAHPVPVPRPTRDDRQAQLPSALPVVRRIARDGSGGATSPTIRREREVNPYATKKSHDGWQLTAHHIIGHSKLKEAHAALTDAQKKDIYTRSIPKTLTSTLLDNAGVKVTVPEGMTMEQHLANLRGRLVDQNDTDPIHGTKIDDVRGAFFEWQQGNQFAGPNTSIRTEPTTDKSDMDFDGRYVASNFDDLEREGQGLYKDLEDGKDSDLIYERLKRILDLTVSKPNADFDPSQWKEITSLEILQRLAADKEFNRPHILNYAFFKLAVAETQVYGKAEPARFEMLRAKNQGNSDYEYTGYGKVDLQVMGTNLFIPIEAAKTQVPKKAVERQLRDVLAELQLRVQLDRGGYRVNVPAALVEYNKDNKLRLKGYPKALLTYNTQQGDSFTFAKEQVDDVIVKQDVPVGVSLHAYLKGLGAPVSSYLPKALYDELITIPDRRKAFEGLLSQAISDELKHTKELNRIGGLKAPTAGELKRAKLREKQRDQAREKQVTYRAELARLKKVS